MNPLEELKDIHAAPVPGWWPLAPGWWLLMVVLILLVVAMVYLFRYYRLRRRQRAILNKFKTVYANYQQDTNAAKLAVDLHQLIRRLMLLHGEQQQVGLAGEAFLHYLDQACDGQPFSDGPGRALLDIPYRPSSATDSSASLAEPLYATVLQWAQRKVRQKAQVIE